MISIYMITNKVNGKAYIGQAKNVEERWNAHINGTSKCKAINAAIKKYGIDAFEFKVIATSPNKAEANVAERFFIKMLGTFKNGYNLTVGGDGVGSGVDHPNYGKSHTHITKLRMSKSHTGEKHALFNKTGKDNPLWGRRHTKQARDKISKAKKNKPNFKLTASQHQEIIKMYRTGNYTQKYLSELYSVSPFNICHIIKKYRLKASQDISDNQSSNTDQKADNDNQ